MDLVLFTSTRMPAECAGAEDAVRQVAKARHGTLHASILDIEKKENRDAAAQFGIQSAPALVLNGERIFKEKMPSGDELSAFIDAKLSEKDSRKGRDRSRYWSISGLPEQWGKD
jgi:thioredoxin-like negative regulator of GroEL